MDKKSDKIIKWARINSVIREDEVVVIGKDLIKFIESIK